MSSNQIVGEDVLALVRDNLDKPQLVQFWSALLCLAVGWEPVKLSTVELVRMREYSGWLLCGPRRGNDRDWLIAARNAALLASSNAPDLKTLNESLDAYNRGAAAAEVQRAVASAHAARTVGVLPPEGR